MAGKIKKIELRQNPGALKKQLAAYRQEAIRLGATDAKVIPASFVHVDERVTLKCQVPLCFGFGTSANCPPKTISPERTARILSMYNHAVIFKIEVPPPVIVRNKETIQERAGAYRKVFDIVCALESKAFYDGHYLSVGFGAGSCKSTFCYKAECASLNGERCRNELRARPSMEAVGMDVYRLAATVGWDIYPIGSGCAVADIPKGSLIGIILIA